MSSTGRGGERRANDFYPTPEWTVRRLLKYVAIPSGTWLEPGAGNGVIIQTMNQSRPDLMWSAIELGPLQPGYSPLLTVLPSAISGDFLTMAAPAQPFTGALGNPPYSLGEQFVRHALSMCLQVIFLMRLSFLETAERQPFHKEFGEPDCFVLPERPSFTDGGTDSCAYAWMRWKRGGQDGRVRVLFTTEDTQKPTKTRKVRAAA
jgi:hypothetical protein